MYIQYIIIYLKYRFIYTYNYIFYILNMHIFFGLSRKNPAIVNITRTVCTTGM